MERKYELLGSQSSQIPEVVFEKAEIEFGLAEMVGARNADSNFRSKEGGKTETLLVFLLSTGALHVLSSLQGLDIRLPMRRVAPEGGIKDRDK